LKISESLIIEKLILFVTPKLKATLKQSIVFSSLFSPYLLLSPIGYQSINLWSTCCSERGGAYCMMPSQYIKISIFTTLYRWYKLNCLRDFLFEVIDPSL